MTTARTATATGLLVLETGLAVMGVVVHHGLTAEYGDASASAFEEWTGAFTAGVSGIALVVLVAAALIVLVVSSRAWMRLTAAVIPVLMVLGMLAVTPAALRQKLDVQYGVAPQCLSEEAGPGPGSRAARDSQRAFESIDHVGHFAGGGGSGVGGCDRSFILTDDVDVIGHYRAALPAAHWRVVESRTGHLRAERDGMAFEVAECGRGGVVWAGTVADRNGARCDTASDTVTGAR